MKIRKLLLSVLVAAWSVVSVDCLAESDIPDHQEPSDNAFISGLGKGVVPRASSRTTLPYRIFQPKSLNPSSRCPNNCSSLGDAAQLLHTALRDSGYDQQAWFIPDETSLSKSVPNSVTHVTVVTELERIDNKGYSVSNSTRWDLSFNGPDVGSLTQFVKTLLLGAPAGRYRSFLFGFSRPESPVMNVGPSWLRRKSAQDRGIAQLQSVIRKGNRVPLVKSLQEVPFDYICYVFVYEFEVLPADGSFHFVEDSSISANDHLKGAGILRALTN